MQALSQLSYSPIRVVRYFPVLGNSVSKFASGVAAKYFLFLRSASRKMRPGEKILSGPHFKRRSAFFVVAADADDTRHVVVIVFFGLEEGVVVVAVELYVVIAEIIGDVVVVAAVIVVVV